MPLDSVRFKPRVIGSHRYRIRDFTKAITLEPRRYRILDVISASLGTVGPPFAHEDALMWSPS